MMARWHLWLGIMTLTAGFALREHAHSLAAQDWAIDTAKRMSDPDGPPACVFDCSHVLSGDAGLLGWIAMVLMVLGVALVVFSSVRRHQPD